MRILKRLAEKYPLALSLIFSAVLMSLTGLTLNPKLSLAAPQDIAQTTLQVNQAELRQRIEVNLPERPPLKPPAGPAERPLAQVDVCFANVGTNFYSSTDHVAVRNAVSAANPGDMVKVAGECVGSTNPPSTSEIFTVFVNKSLTIQGGYTTTNWLTPSLSNHSVLDAEGTGQVIILDTTEAVTLENLHIMNGMYFGRNGAGLTSRQVHAKLTLNNLIFENNQAGQRGGAMYVTADELNIKDSTFFSNTSSSNNAGGAIYGAADVINIENTSFISNTSGQHGGAAYFSYQAGQVLTISHSSFVSNTAQNDGGGLYTFADVLIANSSFISNTTFEGEGGAVNSRGPVIIRHSLFKQNAALNLGGGNGGAVYAFYQTDIDQSIFQDNLARGAGGGVYIFGNDDADDTQVLNTLFAGNRANLGAAALFLYYEGGAGGTANVYYSTFASPIKPGPSDPVTRTQAAISAQNGSVNIGNSIIASHTVGIDIGSGVNQVVEAFNAYYNNDTNFQQNGSPSALTEAVTEADGPINFADPLGKDYQLVDGSIAQDNAGTNSLAPITLITYDLENTIRPQGPGRERGAYEIPVIDLSVHKTASPSLLQPGESITYVLEISNTGTSVAQQVILSDILPAELTGVSYTYTGFSLTETGGSDYVWQVSDLAPAQSGRITITGQIASQAPGASFNLTNTATITGAATLADSDPTNNQSQAIVAVREAVTDLSLENSSPTLLGNATLFTATIASGSSENGPVPFEFDFGDGSPLVSGTISPGTAMMTSHTYANTGFYLAELTTTDPFGQVTASTNVTITKEIDLQLSKTALPNTVQPGQTLVYRLVFTNNSSFLADSVVLTDVVPANLSGVSYTNSGPNLVEIGASDYVWQVAAMSPGQVGVITISGQIPANSTSDSTFTNTASIASPFETTPADNIASASVSLQVPRLSLTTDSQSIAENAGPVRLVAQLDTPNPHAQVTALYSTQDDTATAGTDYTNTSSTALIPPGAVSATLSVPLINDAVFEGDESFTVRLNAATGARLVPPSVATITITDDETAEVTVIPTALNLSEPDGTANFQINLTSRPTNSVTISLSTNNNECSVSPITATISPASWNTGPFVTVSAVDDFILDGPQTCIVETSLAESQDPAYDGLPVDEVTVTVADDDVPAILLTPITTTIGEPDGAAVFTISLSSVPTAPVTVPLAVFLDECTVSPNSVILNENNWLTGTTAMVTVVDDAIQDGSQPCVVETQPAQSPGTVYDAVDGPNLSVTVLDDEVSVDLLIEKTVSPAEVTAGDTFTYTLSYRNQSGDSGSNVEISDSVPPEVVVQEIITSGASLVQVGTPPNYVWQVATLGENEGGQIQLVGQLAPSVNVDQRITNTASIERPISDVNPDDNEASAPLIVTFPPQADVRVTKTGVRSADGLRIDYTIIVENLGPGPAPGTQIVDPLPANVTRFAWTCTAVNGAECPRASGVGSLNETLPSLPVGASVTYQIQADVQRLFASVSNTVTVNVPPEIEELDESNNQASANHPRYQTYLPMLMKNFSYTGAPDLTVESIEVRPESVRIVIKNTGYLPSATSFWVDLYINPDTPPSGPNQEWWKLGTQGHVWGVTTAIQPNESLTLTLNDGYYNANLSAVAGPVPPGTPVYVQVDSANANSTYGSVLEIDEITAAPYNNILGATSLSGR